MAKELVRLCFKLHVGSDDKSIIFDTSNQEAENENHIIRLENVYINTGDSGKIRLWASGESGVTVGGGYAFIEYY